MLAHEIYDGIPNSGSPPKEVRKHFLAADRLDLKSHIGYYYTQGDLMDIVDIKM